MNLNNRLAQLEKRRNERPYNPPQVIEVYGMREDGTRYLIETWKQFVDADKAGQLEPVSWQRFIEAKEISNAQLTAANQTTHDQSGRAKDYGDRDTPHDGGKEMFIRGSV